MRGGGDTGIGEMEKKGDEGWEKGEIGENYATMLNKRLKGGSQEKRGGGGWGEPRVQGTGSGRFGPSLSFRQAALKFCLPGATSQQFTKNIRISFSKILGGNSTTRQKL